MVKYDIKMDKTPWTYIPKLRSAKKKKYFKSEIISRIPIRDQGLQEIPNHKKTANENLKKKNI